MSDTGTRRRGDTETEDLSPRRRVAAPLLAVQTPLSAVARARLHNLLIAKSIVETLFVVALAVGFYYVAFNPYFRGALDVADAQRVAGWAVDESQPTARVEVQLYIDGRFVDSRAADSTRPDVAAAGRADDDRHGFEFKTPTLPPGEHEATVYAVHASGGGARRMLQLLGKPLRFRVEAGAASTATASGNVIENMTVNATEGTTANRLENATVNRAGMRTAAPGVSPEAGEKERIAQMEAGEKE